MPFNLEYAAIIIFIAHAYFLSLCDRQPTTFAAAYWFDVAWALLQFYPLRKLGMVAGTGTGGDCVNSGHHLLHHCHPQHRCRLGALSYKAF